MRAIQKCSFFFILILSRCVKSYKHFCQILAPFTMNTHQIWSRHVTGDANVENVLFCPNSTFNIGKSNKISSEKLSISEVISQKPLGS